MQRPAPVHQEMVQEIVHEDDREEETLQSDAETAKKVTRNEDYTLLTVVTIGTTQIQNTTTDAPLHDENVIAM